MYGNVLSKVSWDDSGDLSCDAVPMQGLQTINIALENHMNANYL
jgi:hypothetical protein